MLDDRDLWWQANCALWAGRITEESLEDQRGSVPPAEFMREFFSWWEDPESVGGALPYDIWMDLADPGAERGQIPVFGLDVDQDRTAWISVVWARGDSLTQVQLANDGHALPAHRAVEECARLTKEWRGPVAAARAFEDDLNAAGVQPIVVSSQDFTAASGAVYDAVTARMLRHGNQPALNAAVKAAAWRAAGTDGSRGFQLKDRPEVGPLAAMTRALHAADKNVVQPFALWG